ncbi:MAG: 2-C-methyl-D-erythritol 4-phosphate cytidylyltransferase [Candidatus Latescibacterota bacterium]
MNKTTALIMAAGTGERFAGEMPKQFCPLAGYPVLAWNVRTLTAVEAVTDIIIIITPGFESRAAEMMDEHGLANGVAIIAGGNTRQESVRLGLGALDDHARFVLVHDAARPCVSRALIERVCKALETDGAVVPALPAVDTLIVTHNGGVDAIVDRSRIAGVQTPQGFHRELLVKAHRQAAARGLTSSDDGSLVLAMGEPVKVVPGESNNIKITYQDDVTIAEAILTRGK